jgi:TetR/AcrR family transcriptional regulator, tetracycline repressor protein
MTNRPGLTREVLIETALRLLDEVGLDGLTVRRLAAELDVKSPALYWHIRTKQELLDGMADRMIQDAGMGPPQGNETWQDWLARRARAYRKSVLSHRDGARIVANASWLSPQTIKTFNDELAAMVERGFPAALALRTITAFSQYTNGFVLQEQAAAREPAERPAVELDSSAPLLVAIHQGVGTVGDEAFEHGLRLLIDGTAIALMHSG